MDQHREVLPTARRVFWLIRSTPLWFTTFWTDPNFRVGQLDRWCLPWFDIIIAIQLPYVAIVKSLKKSRLASPWSKECQKSPSVISPGSANRTMIGRHYKWVTIGYNPRSYQKSLRLSKIYSCHDGFVLWLWLLTQKKHGVSSKVGTPKSKACCKVVPHDITSWPKKTTAPKSCLLSCTSGPRRPWFRQTCLNPAKKYWDVTWCNQRKT